MNPKYKPEIHRSGLETAFRTLVEGWGHADIKYEGSVLSFVTPPKKHKYHPDWEIKPNTFIETKGHFPASERSKILNVIKQNPEVKIYMLFQRAANLISKRSKTTYGDWCDKHGIEWCDFRNTDKWKEWLK